MSLIAFCRKCGDWVPHTTFGKECMKCGRTRPPERLVTCWCEATTLMVPLSEILKGQTRSCSPKCRSVSRAQANQA